LRFTWDSVEKSFFMKDEKGFSVGNDAENGLAEGEPTEAEKPKRA
jgi:hypothetical protein